MRPLAAPALMAVIFCAAAAHAAGPAGQPAPAGRVITLDEAIRTARKLNPSLAAAREKIRQSETWQRKALALFLPTWTASGTYTHFNKDVPFAYPDLTSMHFYCASGAAACFTNFADIHVKFDKYLDYELQKQDSFGASTTVSMYLLNMASFPKYAQVGDQIKAAEAGNKSYESEFIYGVVSAYYAALGAKKIVSVSEEAVTIARGRFNAGDAPKLTHLRAEIEHERALADLRRAENGYAAAREALAVMLDGDASFEVADGPDVPLPAGWDTAKPGADAAAPLFDEACRARPDVTAAELQIAAAEKGKKEVWYRFFPTLNLSGTFRYSDSMGFLGDDYQWFIYLSANMTLYDGGIRYADLREKQSSISETEYNLAAIRASVKGQLRQAAVELDSCAANRSSAVRQVDLAKESQRVAKANFDLGLATSVEVTDANATLVSAQINLAREELSCQLSRLKLLKAIGTINDYYK